MDAFRFLPSFVFRDSCSFHHFGCKKAGQGQAMEGRTIRATESVLLPSSNSALNRSCCTSGFGPNAGLSSGSLAVSGFSAAQPGLIWGQTLVWCEQTVA